MNPPPYAYRALVMSAGSAATSASSSTAPPSEVLPSIDEFRTWGPEQVVEFLEPYITTFSKEERDTFLGGRYDGKTLETMTHHDLAEDVGLPKGPSRNIMVVVNKIRNSTNTNLKRQATVQQGLPPPKRHQREEDVFGGAIEGVNTDEQRTHPSS